MKQDEIQRVQAKTPEQRFMRVLIQEFNYAPKVAEAILGEAQESLLGQAQNLRPGQVRVILLKREAAHGQALSHSETVEVTWTVDAGAEDYEIEQSDGPSALPLDQLEPFLAQVKAVDDLVKSLPPLEID